MAFHAVYNQMLVRSTLSNHPQVARKTGANVAKPIQGNAPIRDGLYNERRG
jgi:hypothetical protein